MQITAAVAPAKGEPLVVEPVELDDTLHGDQLLVKIVAVGVCGADIMRAKTGMGRSEFPIVLGHEGAGIVERVGEDVREFQVGDHVAISYASCGHCRQCLAGRPYACERSDELNFGGVDYYGGSRFTLNGQPVTSFFQQSSFGTYAKVQERNAVKVTKDVDVSLLGPLGCGLQTGAGTVMHILKPEVGSSMAVFGTGTVGDAAIMAAKAMHVAKIIAVDIFDTRLAEAKALGATDIINSKTVDDVPAMIQEMTDVGVDYAVVSAPANGLPEQAIRSTGILGHTAIIGGAAHADLSMMNDILVPARQVTGVLQGFSLPKLFIPQLIQLYQQGDFPFDKLVKFYDLKDVNQAFEDSLNGTTVKAILRMP